jgi:hypothetical protein
VRKWVEGSDALMGRRRSSAVVLNVIAGLHYKNMKYPTTVGSPRNIYR